jgi:phospholipid/cholesterol/gamma-HCH transport system ATP-binding protein
LTSAAPTSSPQAPLVEFRGVSKAFGSQVILNKVDFAIYPGEAIAVIGPSGTGKSTVLRLVAGLLTPDEGEIYIKGKRREGSIDDNENLMGIGLVFQQAALFDSLTVDENVGFLLYQHSKLPRKRIRELVREKLEMVGLGDIGDRYPAELSGGMRKRVSFARAIMEDPDNPDDNLELILYDEPTAGLDPIASSVIEDLIHSLKGVGGACSTYMVVTHQQSTIRNTAERVILLYQGKVQWQGSVTEIDTTDHPMMVQFLRGEIDGPMKVIEDSQHSREP